MKQESGAFLEYWDRNVPWTFRGEKKSYHERRRLRYKLQDYMIDAIPFGSYGGKRVLEIGSGSGIDSAEFGRKGAEIVSLDFSKTGADNTRDTLNEARLSSNVVRAAAQSLPFTEGAFDCVYSFGVLHHIPDVRRPMKEITRVLGSEGDFICMLYNKDSLLYAYSILFLHRKDGLSEDELVSKYSERVERCPYTKAYSKKEVTDLLGNDFRDVSTQVHYNAIDTPGRRKVKIQIPDEYGLGWHIILKAKRAYQKSGSSKRS